MDVDGQGFQGRHVDDLRSLREGRSVLMSPIQPVDADQERGEGLAGAGGSRDQCVPARGDLTPASSLWQGRPVREPSLEPDTNGGMEAIDHPGTLPSARDSELGAAASTG